MLQRERLRQLRLERSYTHEKLAEALGISAKQVWRYEAGESDPTSEVVTRMAKVLAVSADYLLGLTDKETPDLSQSRLSAQEQAVILALRRGDKLAAIRAIVGKPT